MPDAMNEKGLSDLLESVVGNDIVAASQIMYEFRRLRSMLSDVRHDLAEEKQVGKLIVKRVETAEAVANLAGHKLECVRYGKPPGNAACTCGFDELDNAWGDAFEKCEEYGDA